MVRSSSLIGSLFHRLRLSSFGGSNLHATSFRQISSSSSRPCQTSGVGVKDDADARIQKFIHPEVQKLLKELTGMEYERVFRVRKVGQKLKEPTYTFMTEAQLKESLEEAQAKAENVLQMPPVLPPRRPIEKVLAYNPEIAGYDLDGSTLLFTDITMNISDRKRIIVARDPDGTLRHASWEERDKVNKIYYPVQDREVKVPKMFSDLNVLKQVLERASPEDNAYEFTLDRACLQFEPDDPIYIACVEFTYDTISSKGHYDYLKSTRHYGPMVFYLARHRKLDNLIMFNVDHDRITEAGQVVSLFTLIFPESKSAQQITAKTQDEISSIAALTTYIDCDSILKAELQVHLNACLERRRNSEQLSDGLRQSHGIQ